MKEEFLAIEEENQQLKIKVSAISPFKKLDTSFEFGQTEQVNEYILSFFTSAINFFFKKKRNLGFQ